jgi:hypothetical protein
VSLEDAARYENRRAPDTRTTLPPVPVEQDGTVIVVDEDDYDVPAFQRRGDTIR